MSVISNYLVILYYHIGSLVWVIIPELFNQGPRDTAVSFSVNSTWISTLIFSVTFEFMAISIHAMQSYQFNVFDYYIEYYKSLIIATIFVHASTHIKT